LAYAGGDINGSGLVDRNDVTIFRNVFDGGNGAGSFERMVAALGVPEPSTVMLSALACGMVLLARRRRGACPNRVFSRKLPNMMHSRRLTPWIVVLAACLAAIGFPAGTAKAVPVGSATFPWQADTLNTPLNPNPIVNPDTDHPTVGTGAADSANQLGIWAAIDADLGTPAVAEPMTLASGQEIKLTGQVKLTGVGMGTANGAFRVGLFQDTMAAGTTANTAAWLGYLASNSSGGPNGRLDAKNPDANDWLTASHISTNSTAQYSGNCVNAPGVDQGCGNRVFNLATGGSNDGFDDDTYTFNITVGRYGDEVTVSAAINSTTLTNPVGDYNDDGTVNAADYTVWRDHLNTAFVLPNRAAANMGNVSAADYTTWRTNFGNVAAGYAYNLGGGVDREGAPPSTPPGGTAATTVTPHVPFTYNRVSLFFANHLQADLGEVSAVDVSTQTIQTLKLEVDLANNGASRFINNSTQNFDMIYYEITSESGALQMGNWTSFDDADPNAPDPLGVAWDEAGGSSANVLSEINLNSGGEKPFNIGNSFNLGNIFNTAGAHDLRFFFLQSDGSLVRGLVNYLGPGSGSASAVPEPGSFALLSAGALLCAVCGQRGRRCLNLRQNR
jgi:hypothetical protein